MPTEKRKEQLIEEARESFKEEEIANSLATSTTPGLSNTSVFEGLSKAEDIARAVEDDLNNWIDIIDFRVYRKDKMSIACKYRWTIIRWAENDMDSWLMDNGWTIDAHRLADSYDRDEDQTEARYRKEFDGVTVYANILVDFPNAVFEELEGNNTVERKREKLEQEENQQNRKMKVLNSRRE